MPAGSNDTSSLSSLASEARSDSDLLVTANSNKENGNAKLKEQDFQSAYELYGRGLESLDKVIDKADEQYISLYRALNLNRSLAAFKIQEYYEGFLCANAVLKSDPMNPKASYRSALCNRGLGNLENAKDLLLKLLEAEPRNLDARNCLQTVMRLMQENRKKDKEAFSGLFSNASLYDDRVVEADRLRCEQEKKVAEMKVEWETAMASLPEDSRQTFEVWKEEKEEQIRIQEEEAKKKMKEADDKRRSIGRAPGKVHTDELELDEEDRKIIEETKQKGYCYFKKVLTEEDKALNAANRPAELSPESSNAVSPAIVRGVSEWNSKGATYEEKDTTKWATGKIEEALKSVVVKTSAHGVSPQELMSDPQKFAELASIIQNPDSSAVDRLVPMATQLSEISVTGESQVVVVRGSKRYLYDFTIRSKFCIEINLHRPVKINGSLDITDFSSIGASQEISGCKFQFKLDDPTDPDLKPVVDLSFEYLKKAINEALQDFDSTFKRAF